MIKRTQAALSCIVMIGMILMSCGGSGGGSSTNNTNTSGATLVSIAVTPASPSIAYGLTQQFTATGTYTDNTQHTVTTTAIWSSSSNTVATISNTSGSNGLVTSAGKGTTTITATVGDISGSTNVSVTTEPTTAVLKIISQGILSSGTKIGAISVTAVLPAGVTVKATAVASVLVTDAGVVAPSGTAAAYANTAVQGTYTAASSTVPGHVTAYLVSPDGLGTGEVMAITCDIASGSTPTASDFSLSDFKAFDLNGSIISGLTSRFTATFQ